MSHDRVKRRIGSAIFQASLDIRPKLRLPQLLDVQHADIGHGPSPAKPVQRSYGYERPQSRRSARTTCADLHHAILSRGASGEMVASGCLDEFDRRYDVL